MANKKRILLLTNRDSDNTGDQVMEICDIALISAVMTNLGLESEDYEISSRGAAAFTKVFFHTGDASYLNKARETLKETDLVIYGGAPLFNYTYQKFYERTALFIDICQELNVPVIISAVGIEYFDETNPKCLRIKNAINQPVVKMVTTRDDYESLKKMKEREDLLIAPVADPAVFSKEVFCDFIAESEDAFVEGSAKEKNAAQKKRIGLFVLRAHGFKDNGYDFDYKKAVELWKGVTNAFEKKGYEVSLLTSGHFGDEAFLDRMIRNHGLDKKKCIFNINTPEDVVEAVSNFDGVVSCRLNPSIISYSLGVPTVGLEWNMKVRGFYESIGYENRVIAAKDLSVDVVVDALEKAMEEGVKEDLDFRMSVYRTLFESIQNVFGLAGECYDYDRLLQVLEPFAGTDEEEAQLKLRRKFRRIYENYNNKYTDASEFAEFLKPLKWLYQRIKK